MVSGVVGILGYKDQQFDGERRMGFGRGLGVVARSHSRSQALVWTEARKGVCQFCFCHQTA